MKVVQFRCPKAGDFARQLCRTRSDHIPFPGLTRRSAGNIGLKIIPVNWQSILMPSGLFPYLF